MSDTGQQERPRIADPDSPATEKQREYLKRLGVDPPAADDPRLTKGQASSWIDDYNRASASDGKPEPPKSPLPPAAAAPGFTTADKVPPAAAAPGFTTADKVPPAAASPQPPPAQSGIEPYGEDEDRGPLTPVAALSDEQRRTYGVEETGTVVIQGKNWNVVPELGMPAKFVFARISSRGGRLEARLFPSIEGLMFRANAYHQGIAKLRFEFVKQEDIPGLDKFLDETKDPELICRAHVTLRDGTEVTEEGTLRLSEITLFKSKRTGRMVSRAPVGRTNPTELVKKRALARALRWGTGFGGTALDELPAADAEEARERAGLRSGSAALPPGPE